MSGTTAGTYVQLSKPYFSSYEIEYIQSHNKDLHTNIRNFNSKSKEVFQAIIKLSIKLNLPLRILQNSNYFYQRFYLLNNNYKKYSNLHYEVGLATLFISLKLNDYIKKIAIVINEALSMKEYHLTNLDIEENKKIIVSLERKILEFQSFDFRNFLAEDYLIKFLKFNKSTSPSSSYVIWSTLNDLYLTSLVLQYPAHYNALISINCGSLILSEINNLYPDLLEIPGNENGNPIDSILPHLKSISSNNDDESNSFLLNGTNQLLEYLIDNLNITFTRNSLHELGLKLNDKQIIDFLINIKIEINNKIKTSQNHPYLDNDLFFQPRNTDIAKNGSLRFLYKKDKYTQEAGESL